MMAPPGTAILPTGTGVVFRDFPFTVDNVRRGVWAPGPGFFFSPSQLALSSPPQQLGQLRSSLGGVAFVAFVAAVTSILRARQRQGSVVSTATRRSSA